MTEKPLSGRSNPTHEQIAQDFDRLTQTYSDEVNQAIAFTGLEHTFYIDVKRAYLLQCATEHFGHTKDLDVLDLGCGIGSYHAGLENKFRELHGVDVSAQSVEMAAQKYKFLEYKSYDGITLPYPDGRFDLIFTICVMHHVPIDSWQNFVKEIGRVLRPKGLALVFEHNPYNPITRYVVNSCAFDKDAVLLSPKHLRTLFSTQQFRNVKTRTILSVPPKGKLLQRMDHFLGHLPFGAQYYLSATRTEID
jgi:SAM-dependent methyltransferase